MVTIAPVRLPTSAARPFRIIPQLDEYQGLVAFSQTVVGKSALLCAFAVGLVALSVRGWVEIIVALTILSYVPARRRLLISLFSIYWLFIHNTWVNWSFLNSIAVSGGHGSGLPVKLIGIATLISALCLVAALFRHVQTHRNSIAAKRPVICLLVAASLLLLAAALSPAASMAHLVLWIAYAGIAPCIWYFAYALKDAASTTADRPFIQLGTIRPFWGGSSVPFAKGAANLRKTEASSAGELSVIQLKALKLLMWAIALKVLLWALDVVVFSEPTGVFRHLGLDHFQVPRFGVPDLDSALSMESLPISVAWLSVLGHFAEAVLKLSIHGHVVIACGRMAGFNLLRNTYKPLHSRTVAEFWNRYYFYFKELLVEFFFFPAFTRYFKKHRRLRTFAATIAAATVGNLIYHFLDDFNYVAGLGLWEALVRFHTYLFYCCVLGAGIGISQLRGQGKPKLAADAPWWRKSLATCGVLAFFCLIEVFDQEGRSHSLMQCTRFFLHLFFIPA